MEWRKMRRFRQQISKEECLEVLRNEKRGVLALNGENGYPYALPVNFFYDEADGRIYFHGAEEGAKMDCLQADDRVCFVVYTQGFQKEGDWAYYPTSIIVRGRVSILSDPAKIKEQCRKIGLKYYPTEESVEKVLRDTEGRFSVLALSVEHMTGKLVHES